MNKPDHLIPQSQKGREWVIEHLKYISSIALNNTMAKKKDLQCWQYFNNQWNEKEFEYLTKIGSGTNNENDYYLPAKIRHIPLQRNKLNLLISQQRHRPWTFQIVIDNMEGRKDKQARKIQSYLNEVNLTIQNIINQYQSQLMSIEQQMNEFGQMLQQEPKTPEEQQQLIQLQQATPMIQQQMGVVIEQIQKQIDTTLKEQSKLRRLQGYKKIEWEEDIAQKVALYLRKVLQIERKSVKNFISHVVVGKQAYYVDYIPGWKLPIFESVNIMQLDYPASESVESIQWGDWVMLTEYKAKSEIIATYKFTEEEVEFLEQYEKNYMPGGTVYTEQSFLDNISNNLYSGSYSTEQGISVKKIFFRSIRKIQAKKSPNPHEEGKYFTHFISDETKVINTGQLKWDSKKKKYIDKETDDEYDKKKIINEIDGELLIERYIDEVYEGHIIGDKIYKNCGKRSIRLTYEDDYQRTPLPIVGPTFNSIINRPYSLIWETKDIQKLYNVVNFHRELILATAGTKGLVMDMSQKPDGMSKEEWLYYTRIGAAWIETFKKTGKVNTSFNQFTPYDNSLSPSIQYIDGILQSLDMLMGNMIGVPLPRQGQVIPTDQVGTYEASNRQANLMTEIIYADHDECERQALEQLINLDLKYCHKDGGFFDYQSDYLSSDIFKIPANVLNKYDWKILIGNNTKDEQAMNDLKRLAFQEYQKQTLSFAQLISVYNTETLKDLEKKAVNFIEEFEIKMQKANEQNRQFSKQDREDFEKLKAELEIQTKTAENQLKQVDLELKKQIEGSKLMIEQQRLQLEREKMNLDSQVKMLNIEGEREVETAYLGEQTRANQVNEKLKAIELQMKALNDALGNKNEGRKIAAVEKGKIGTKEKIKD